MIIYYYQFNYHQIKYFMLKVIMICVHQCFHFADLLLCCRSKGLVAEIVHDPISHKDVQELFSKFGLQHPSRSPVSSGNYIGEMDNGALVEAVYKQWFGEYHTSG